AGDIGAWSVPGRWCASSLTPHSAPAALTARSTSEVGGSDPYSPRTTVPTATAVTGSTTVSPASTVSADPRAYAVWTSQTPTAEAGASAPMTTQPTGDSPSPARTRAAATCAPEATHPNRTPAAATRARWPARLRATTAPSAAPVSSSTARTPAARDEAGECCTCWAETPTNAATDADVRMTASTASRVKGPRDECAAMSTARTSD